MIKEKWMKHIFAGVSCLVALIVYAMTMAPTVSFWDCGEFVACANTLGIPHPPGTPFFVFLARAVIVLLPFVGEIAKRVNYISVVSSAATVYVTALFAWEFLASILKSDALAEKISDKMRTIVLATASLVAGFLLTFSDTFWFNAVEAEVYGLAMFILMLVSYLGLVWYNKRDEEGSDKFLIFICYIAFLGVGAHLYTMLTVPAVFVLLLLAQPKKIVERIPVWITGTLLCSVIYMVSAFIELSLGCLVVLAILSVAKPFKANVNKAVRLSLAFSFFALVGYSTHLYIPIRSELNPIIDENDPEINIRDEQGNLQLGNLFKAENWESFNNFVERKQYGSESMISRAFYRRSQLAHQFLSFPSMSYGGYQMAQYLPFKVGGVNYANGVYTFDPSENEASEHLGFKFPTQMSFMGDAILPQLIIFLIFNGLLIMVCVYACKRNRHLGVFLSILYGLCSLGLIFYINFADGTRMERRDHDQWVAAMARNVNDLNRVGANIPFVPDPNDLLAMRQDIEHYNIRLESMRQHKASAEAVAAVEAKINDLKSSSVWSAWTKIESGYAQVGQRAPFPEAVHMEVRERDYFYTPAFIFMSMMFGIGAGILVLLAATTAAYATFATPIAAVLIAVSFLMPCFSNFKEHDRSGLWVPWDYAYNLLNSCRPNAILFTNGDNDTFPLWFAQEVAGVRKDVRVVNLSLGNTDWYIKQMLDNEPILKLSYDKAAIDRDMVLDNSYGNNPNHLTSTWVKNAERLMPRLKDRISQMESQGNLSQADSAKLLQLKVHYQVWDAFHDWASRSRSSIMLTQHKLVIDLAMQNMDKPIHFSTTVGTSNFMGLEKYLVQEGMIYDFKKGDLTPRRNDFDPVRTANMIDSVYKFRGLGDGTAYVNGETLRLLSSYVSLYLQISFDAREQISAIRNDGPLTIAKKAKIDALALNSIKYLELGMFQFPEEWRNYWAAAYVYEAAGMKQPALDVLARGLKNIPDYDDMGRARLAMSLKSMEAMPDEPLKVEDAPKSDSTSVDSTPVLASASN